MFKSIVQSTLSSLLKTCFPFRQSKDDTESRQIAHLYYKVEVLSQESDLLKLKHADEKAASAIENLGFVESEKLKKAVTAAKQGATSKQIARKYAIFDAEAELIVSVHGTTSAINERTLH